VTLNLALVFDLIIMILYPFSQKKKFMTMYVAGCFAFSVSLSAAMTYAIMSQTEKYNIGFWCLLIMYTAMFFGGFGSIIFAYMRLSKPGISASARTLILKRHAMSITVFIITNLSITVTIAYIVFGITMPNPEPSESLWWTILFKILYYLEGVISPLIRLNEPVFRVLLLKTLKSDL
jgi:phage shock protein PspC (stress-responsive transcriptional regulator)